MEKGHEVCSREKRRKRPRKKEARAETLKLRGESMDEADDYIKRVKTSDEANTERTRTAACRVTCPSEVFPLALSAAGAALAVEAADVDEAEAAETLADEAAALTDAQVWLEGIDKPFTRMTSEHLREKVKEEDQQRWKSWKGKNVISPGRDLRHRHRTSSGWWPVEKDW